MDVEDLNYLYGTIDIDKIQQSAYNNTKHLQFLRKYGTLLIDKDLERNGKTLSIIAAVYQFCRLLLMAIILVEFLYYPLI
jgi:hypothetical protein